MKKPTLDEFKEVLETVQGNLTYAAKRLGVDRRTVYLWINSDEEFKYALSDSRKACFDDILDSSRRLARGVPRVVDGKFMGWIERPDAGMAKYLLSTLGRDEGFNENIDITSGGNALPKVINLICEDKIRDDE